MHDYIEWILINLSLIRSCHLYEFFLPFRFEIVDCCSVKHFNQLIFCFVRCWMRTNWRILLLNYFFCVSIIFCAKQSDTDMTGDFHLICKEKHFLATLVSRRISSIVSSVITLWKLNFRNWSVLFLREIADEFRCFNSLKILLGWMRNECNF